MLKKITIEAALGGELEGHPRLSGLDDKILFLYAKGLTTREVASTFKVMYGADVSQGLVSKVTNALIEEVIQWQSRPLDPVCTIFYLDCIVVKIRQEKQVVNKAIWAWVLAWKVRKSC